MCGPQVTDRPRGGALAALSPPTGSSPRARKRHLQGDLAFHQPGHPASCKATHARLTPAEHHGLGDVHSVRVVIHSTGDLTKDAADCGFYRQFTFPAASSSDSYFEIPLETPLSLEVGSNGIIGRRVSISAAECEAGSEGVLAEGIVGFNFLDQRPSL
ncbi:uncharacterized protein UV8b_00848 [Ustilaginoidea virens]|uniref:Uncharacterized protein n=1 Tax=Ustilaginoidea virens TaxID=1159556 RepID=A0A8E5MEG8_USTVR|nr:uncharacterized protein UV8b_00848 [Ustilaginoidea virens]QUC16607.1 hypothetical protein UV8b_00848 [Ustilaginoidea virens]